ncbi:hypothetical protein CLCOS_33050 [Clostridium coskatii]|uniref:Uncharacterized protein n=1 Tax=Clostridium coskatii TaxID=1705578 RepID=A0A162JGW7_9CLOT|nr:hypothetical protein WX73_01333 [Clostridium coskatii]OBR91665.1 hypothetical protein CLCOS_33050 [Clostridium coskatii]
MFLLKMISLTHKFNEFILLYIKNNICGTIVIDKSKMLITSLGNVAKLLYIFFIN